MPKARSGREAGPYVVQPVAIESDVSVSMWRARRRCAARAVHLCICSVLTSVILNRPRPARPCSPDGLVARGASSRVTYKCVLNVLRETVSLIPISVASVAFLFVVAGVRLLCSTAYFTGTATISV
jgi:hypothetical protein